MAMSHTLLVQDGREPAQKAFYPQGQCFIPTATLWFYTQRVGVKSQSGDRECADNTWCFL